MNRTAFMLLLCTVPASAVHAQAPAGRSLSAGTWMLTAELGGSAFTAFQRLRATPGQGAEGVGVERRVSASTTATLGASIGYWAGVSWGVRGGLSWSPSNFTVAYDEAADTDTVANPVGGDATETYASLAVWGADLSLLFRFPRSFGRVRPYGIVGGGVVRYAHGTDAEVPAEALESFEGGERTQAAALLGIGAMIPLQRHDLLLSFELTDRMSRSPLAGNARVIADDGVELDTAASREGGQITNQLRLVVGLTLPLR
jgi:hypothetical protein